jgi:hypothetical protein
MMDTLLLISTLIHITCTSGIALAVTSSASTYVLLSTHMHTFLRSQLGTGTSMGKERQQGWSCWKTKTKWHTMFVAREMNFVG